VSPTQWHDLYNLCVLDFEDIVLLTKNIDKGVNQICPPWCWKVKICILNFKISIVVKIEIFITNTT